jgi:hypothetical protein
VDIGGGFVRPTSTKRENARPLAVFGPLVCIVYRISSHLQWDESVLLVGVSMQGAEDTQMSLACEPINEVISPREAAPWPMMILTCDTSGLLDGSLNAEPL